MYNQKQRREIYLKALKMLVEKDESAPYMCHLLANAIDPSAGYKRQGELLLLFPEWKLCHPLDIENKPSLFDEDFVWKDSEWEAFRHKDKEFTDLRETILCLSLVQ